MNDLMFIWAGRLAVDSGMLGVADPVYWDDERLSGEPFIEAMESEDDELPIELGNLDHVGASMGLVFPTFVGDGMFDVYTVWRNENMVGFFTSFVPDDFSEAAE